MRVAAHNRRILGETHLLPVTRHETQRARHADRLRLPQSGTVLTDQSRCGLAQRARSRGRAVPQVRASPLHRSPLRATPLHRVATRAAGPRVPRAISPLRARCAPPAADPRSPVLRDRSSGRPRGYRPAEAVRCRPESVKLLRSCLHTQDHCVALWLCPRLHGLTNPS